MATLSSTPAMSSIPSTNPTFAKDQSITQSSSQPINQEVARDMEANRIPNDKEDPRYQTKALPFASTNEQECEELIKTAQEPSIIQSTKQSFNQSIQGAKQTINQSMEGHNGNVLDRTMDQIRGWVHSFKSEPQYEEYEIEVDDDESTDQSIKASANQAAASAKSSANQAAASAKQSLNQASASAKSSAAQASESAKQTAASAKQSINQSINQASDKAAQVSASAKSSAAQASESAKQSVNQASASAKQTAAQVSESAKSAAAQASDKLGQMKDSASALPSQLSSAASQQAAVAQSKLGSLKDQVVHTVSDLGQTISQSVNQYSATLHDTYESGVSSVNEFVASHPSINQSINENLPSLPSTEQIRDYSSKMLPPLAAQASSSWAFAGSFLAQYMANMKEFAIALRQQNVVVLGFTVLTFINHFVLPWFFLDKSAARSVLYCYVLASLAAHFTFFVSGHLRYQWLGHLLFVPMVLSLLFNQGFREAGDVAELIDSFKQGDRVGTAFAAPFSLRSYLFVIWMRGILMNQAVLGTFDLVNVMDLLGLNLGTRWGEEMPLIQGSVKNFRRQLAASVHGAADTLDVNQPAHRGHGRKRRGSAQSNQQPIHQSTNQSMKKSSSPAPQQHAPQQHSQQHSQQHWVKKSTQSEQPSSQPSSQPMNQSINQSNYQSDKMLSDKPVMTVKVQPKSEESSVRVESHEKSSNELRQRNTVQSAQY